jgi:hypothetical protein
VAGSCGYVNGRLILKQVANSFDQLIDRSISVRTVFCANPLITIYTHLDHLVISGLKNGSYDSN